MKKTKTIFTLILLSTLNFAIAQEQKKSKFSMGFGASEQYVGKDSGENFEGFLGYSLTSDITLNLSYAHAKMRSDAFNLKYKLEKYVLQMNYGFGKSENTKFESIFGFSYLNFDKKILPTDNNGMGIDLGFQTTFNVDKRLNYGLRIISTYSSISPGAILNAGINLRYNL
jgi:hypothetical protein